jgi:hypothetical protein
MFEYDSSLPSEEIDKFGVEMAHFMEVPDKAYFLCGCFLPAPLPTSILA